MLTHQQYLKQRVCREEKEGNAIADGITHRQYLRKVWLAIVPIGMAIFLFALGANTPNPLLYPLFFYYNYLLCEVVDPDLDQLSLTIAEGIVLRTTKKFYMGFFGALFVSYSFLYSYIIGLFGGHRSRLSHGWIIGTLGRMVFYNIPFYLLFVNIYSYGLAHWGWSTQTAMQDSFYMDIWLIPFLQMQFLAWFIGDATHLILDSEWAKGTLYTPIGKTR